MEEQLNQSAEYIDTLINLLVVWGPKLVGAILALIRYLVNVDTEIIDIRTMIPLDLLLTVDTKAGTAQVIDGIIQQQLGKPVEATVIDINDARILGTVNAGLGAGFQYATSRVEEVLEDEETDAVIVATRRSSLTKSSKGIWGFSAMAGVLLR